MNIFLQAVLDILTVWAGKSPMKLWVRIWLVFLLCGVMIPFPFLPHPFAWTNLAAFHIILIFNGREVLRVRGVNKAMGWPHLVGWIPVLVVNILSIFTDTFQDYGKLTWDRAEDGFEKARVFGLWYNTVTLFISCLFDANDTYQYYMRGVKEVDQSEYTRSTIEKDQ
mmetsp:Transcript_3096/g.4253  ORF Transcript_3096/g.4253 Transcript_3096/m.4253 type:complete len:167 (-) Transcript_3096:259-759(-)